VVVAAAAVIALLAQTAMTAGDPSAAMDPEIIGIVLTESGFGRAIVVRLAAGLVALAAILILRPDRKLWLTLSVLGGVVLATFAWTGHGAAEKGAAGMVHAAADVLHLLAAGVWLGAVAAFALLLAEHRRAGDGAGLPALHAALAGFSGVGSAVVAVILATGLINSWFLVGPSRVWQIGDSTYGILLLAKVGLFIAMLGLAAANRFILTPRLAYCLPGRESRHSVAAIRRSVLLETAAGFLILALVSVMGMLSPVSAQ